MSDIERRDDLLIAVALTRFHQDFAEVDPELSEQAWQLAADRLLDYDLGPEEIVDELGIGS
ncbi:hypothetical protein [Natronorubrum halophilum]|uniref:hypothetical protein n=1 Tax=Natronorubrum halophilum TaxID=1702106 RepID=UPI0010C1BE90|nr:hypothetical protein [Natronorubrum halophilum]